MATCVGELARGGPAVGPEAVAFSLGRGGSPKYQSQGDLLSLFRATALTFAINTSCCVHLPVRVTGQVLGASPLSGGRRGDADQ